MILKKLQDLLSTNQSTALCSSNKFISLENPDSNTLRQTIVQYAMDRSAPHDILLFYFSGHGVPIGNYDLGLCTKDTCVHHNFHLSIPLSLVKFSDIVETLAIVKVDPVIIIDACFSGQAGESIQQIYSQLKRTIQTETGSAYALLCSSTKIEETPDHFTGGPFSHLLTDIAKNGLGGVNHRRKRKLSLQDLYPNLRKRIENELDIVPQLFIGGTLPEFMFVKNIQYKPRRESLAKGHKTALLAFWNNGNPITLSTEELQILGSSAHTTYSKLGYSPAWALIEKVDSRRRRLSSRSLDFLNSKIRP